MITKPYLVPLIGKTCSELESLVDPDSYDEWCSILSQDTVDRGDGKCALEACCFCGGGSHVDTPCTNKDGWEDGLLDCQFLDLNNLLCETFKTVSIGGMLPEMACCACGGGSKTPHNTNRLGGGSDPQDGGSGPQDQGSDPQDSGCSGDVLRRRERRRELAESSNSTEYTFDQGGTPGIPNLEYLGIGYNSLKGNPRGSSSSEIDPGFLNRVVKLIQKQDDLSVDGAFTIPVGTEFRYTSSCKYDDTSQEISTGSDYRSTLEKEAKLSLSSRSSTSGGVNTLIYDFQASFDTSSSFELNADFRSFTDTSVAENTVTFEARAVCSEFEVFFNPFAELVLDENFQNAVDSLPCQFDPENQDHVTAYSIFFEAYGTHYTKQVILGGKRIVSTKMSSRDYSSLVRDSVDVATSLTFDVQAAMGASVNINAGVVKAGLSLLGPKGAAVSNIIDIATGGDDSTSLFGANFNRETGFTLDAFSRSKSQAESVEKIQSKNTRTTEVNIGGLPDVDWRTWATTVEDKPMPISYELAPIWELIDEEKRATYFDALKNIFGIDLEPENNEGGLLDAMHFGIVRGTGEPISSHLKNPNSKYRALLDVGLVPTDLRIINNELRVFTTTEGGMTTTTRELNFQPITSKVEVVTYGTTWRGKQNLTGPIFASVINGDVGRNNDEEKAFATVQTIQLPPITIDVTTAFRRIIDIDNNVPFGLLGDISSAGRIAMTNFIKGKEAGDLQSFSFLSAENLPTDEGLILSGVVSNDGLVLYPNTDDPGFEVIISSGNGISSKVFEVTVQGTAIFHATVILFPQFFSSAEANEYPKDVGQVAIGALTSFDPTNRGGWKASAGNAGKFSVKMGKEKEYTREGSRFGFNFLVLGSNLNNGNVKHGYVHGLPDDVEIEKLDFLYGLEVDRMDAFFKSAEKTFMDSAIGLLYLPALENAWKPGYTANEFSGYEGGVEVMFKEPYYNSLPSVIVTPVLFDDRDDLGTIRFEIDNTRKRKISVPKCVVETITTKNCHVKCGMFTIEQTFEIGELPPGDFFGITKFEYVPLPFNIVVVGTT